MDALILTLIIPLIGALVIILSPKDFKKLSILHIAFSFLTSLALLCNVFRVVDGSVIFTFDKFLFLDSLGAVFLFLIAVTGFLVNLYSVFYMKWEVDEDKISLKELRIYYSLCFVFIFTMTLSVICNNIAFMWAAIEATTLSSVFLVATHKDKKSTESGYKYIILCSIGLAFALYATILLYSSSLTHFNDSYEAMLFTSLRDNAEFLDKGALQLIFIFALIGFGTKAGLAPTHTWLPDAHAQGPAPISALLSGVLLKCAMLALIRYYSIVANCIGFGFVENVMVVSGVLTLLVSSFFLIRQHDVKRMFAYHSIAHMGVIAFGLGVGGAIGVFAAIFHCLAHSFTKALAFCSTGNIQRIYGTKDMTKMGSMIHIAPFTTILFGISICSLVGVPAFAIFVSEFLIFKAAAISSQYILMGVFALFLAIIFIADFSHFFMSSFGDVKGEIKHNKEMKFIENLPLLLLAILVVAFGIWQFDFFTGLLNNSVESIGYKGFKI